jgi:hypothetical protein
VHDLLISPSVGGVGLDEYVCAHPCLTNCYSGRPQRASMVWYSDEALEAFAIVVWSLVFVLFLVALALPCPLRRRDVKD